MNILLTGGLGFIGSHVASVLGQDIKNKIIIISGPTATGKTGLSIEIAKKYGAEVPLAR